MSSKFRIPIHLVPTLGRQRYHPVLPDRLRQLASAQTTPAELAGLAKSARLRRHPRLGRSLQPGSATQRGVRPMKERRRRTIRTGKRPIQYLSFRAGNEWRIRRGFLCGWTAEGSRPTFDFVTGISAGRCSRRLPLSARTTMPRCAKSTPISTQRPVPAQRVAHPARRFSVRYARCASCWKNT